MIEVFNIRWSYLDAVKSDSILLSYLCGKCLPGSVFLSLCDLFRSLTAVNEVNLSNVFSFAYV